MRIRRYTVGTLDLCDDCVKVCGDSEPFIEHVFSKRRPSRERYLTCERCGGTDKSHRDYQEYKKLMDAAYGHE